MFRTETSEAWHIWTKPGSENLNSRVKTRRILKNHPKKLGRFRCWLLLSGVSWSNWGAPQQNVLGQKYLFFVLAKTCPNLASTEKLFLCFFCHFSGCQKMGHFECSSAQVSAKQPIYRDLWPPVDRWKVVLLSCVHHLFPIPPTGKIRTVDFGFCFFFDRNSIKL